jgi:hypothetical protein
MTHAVRLEKSSIRTQNSQLQSGQRATVQKERVLSEQLWCVHIEGLDDSVATLSREAAEREASAINAYLESNEHKASTAVPRASVMEWPFSAESHARSLEVDSEDLERMPHRLAASNRPREGRLQALARRLKTLARGMRSGG